MGPWRQLTMIGLGALLLQAGPACAAAPDQRVSRRVMMLARDTVWTKVGAIRIAFDTFHPQGMVRIGENFYVSSVEVRREPRKLATPRDGQRYDAGAGIGHLFKIGPHGELLADLVLGEGSIYHPGGIDFDGSSIWVPVAEYRPDSRAIVYKVAPDTMTATVAFTVADHVGGLVHDVDGRRIVGLSWGSRRFYAWPDAAGGKTPQASTAAPVANPESYIDYQDCHYAGARRMLCGGLAEYRPAPGAPMLSLGGLDLIDVATFRPVWQAPVPLWAPSGRAMTQNPFWVEPTSTGLRAYFMPDDDVSTVFVYDAAMPVQRRPPPRDVTRDAAVGTRTAVASGSHRR